MSIWDKVKSITDEVKAITQEVTSNKHLISGEDRYEEDVEISTGRPSKPVKKVLSTAASIFLKSSKKIVNSVVSKYHPPLSLSVINSEREILKILNSANLAKNIDKFELAELASNNLSTLLMSNKIDKEIREELKSKVDYLKKEYSENPDSESTSKRLNQVKRKLEEFENSEFQFKLKMLNLIQSNDTNSSKEFRLLLSKLDKSYPDWHHPLISCHVVDNFSDFFGDVKTNKYINKMLYSNPLHTRFVELSKSKCIDDEKVIYDQILSLLNH